MAHAADVAPAVPALLGCIECALDELANASAALTETPHAAASDGSQARTSRVRAAEERQGLANVEAVLMDARDIASRPCVGLTRDRRRHF